MLITADQLLEFFGAQRDGDVTRLLERERVPYFRGVGGRPCTTEAALNKGLGLESGGFSPPAKEWDIDYKP